MLAAVEQATATEKRDLSQASLLTKISNLQAQVNVLTQQRQEQPTAQQEPQQQLQQQNNQQPQQQY